jgi:hypothetical protein
MDSNATDHRSEPLSGLVEELCYHDQGVDESKNEGSRAVAGYEAEINCLAIIMRLTATTLALLYRRFGRQRFCH